MRIYTEEECKQWLLYRKFRYEENESLVFDPIIDVHILEWQLADIKSKNFQHNLDRMQAAIYKTVENYPRLEHLLENLNILMCPKPSANTCNACANYDFICFFGRSTQIPWCVTDYVTVHELGHIVDQNLCTTENKMKDYLSLRGFKKTECEVCTGKKDGEWTYKIEESYECLHGTVEQRQKYRDWDKNHLEFFAEDFRYLFGVDQGDKFWGLDSVPPNEEIKEFMLSL